MWESYVSKFRMERLYYGPHILANKKGAVDVQGIFPRVVTIKIYNLNERSIQGALQKSSKIIEDCLFQLSYLKNSPFWLVEEWPNTKNNKKAKFKFGTRFVGWNLPLKGSYNSQIIRFYQLGLTSRIPELKFLSFYQVLEYFFTSVSKQRLYEKLANQLKDPKFQPMKTR